MATINNIKRRWKRNADNNHNMLLEAVQTAKDDVSNFEPLTTN